MEKFLPVIDSYGSPCLVNVERIIFIRKLPVADQTMDKKVFILAEGDYKFYGDDAFEHYKDRLEE